MVVWDPAHDVPGGRHEGVQAGGGGGIIAVEQQLRIQSMCNHSGTLKCNTLERNSCNHHDQIT